MSVVCLKVVFVQQVATLPFHVREGEKERGMENEREEGVEGDEGGGGGGTGVARIFFWVGSTRPTPPSLTSVVHTLKLSWVAGNL